MKFYRWIVSTLSLMLMLTGCSASDTQGAKDNGSDALSSAASSAKSTEDLYQKLTAQQAKQMIDDNPEVIILDVRTQEEYTDGHIEGSILLPVTEISASAEKTLPDKDATILVYCRSGNRSQTAAYELIELGYTDVYDFGGIIDWPYGTVK